jgi:hypothetical protein
MNERNVATRVWGSSSQGRRIRGAALVALSAWLAACGGGRSRVEAPGQASSGGADATPGANDGSQAGDEPAAAAAEKPPERPFAKTQQEATAYIDEAIQARATEVVRCVEGARTRRKDPHARIEVDLGIDQEGQLIGVKTPKGAKDDPALLACMRDALNGALFPRSQAGVITIRKSFETQVVYPGGG